MKTAHWISLIPKSPLYFGQEKPKTFFLPTQTLIPGSVIRGALAEYLIAQGRDSEIRSLVENMRFGFFYPSPTPFLLPFPFPATTLGCKRFVGFKSEQRHGIFDSLLASIAYKELKKSGAKFPVPLTFKCRDCDSRMDRITGFYVKEDHYRTVKIEKISQTKVAINRQRRVAEEQMLYSVTAINPKITFIGRVGGQEENVELLLDALKTIGVGGLTTRGYGNVDAKRIDLTIDPIETRIKAFNEHLKKIWGDLVSLALNERELPAEPEELFFSLDLLSTAIFRNQGIPTLKLTFIANGESFEPVFFSTNPIFVGGWATGWGLPKETCIGAEIGSTYVFKVSQLEILQESLKKLENDGVGERRNEGFGDTLVCHPFHKEVEPI